MRSFQETILVAFCVMLVVACVVSDLSSAYLLVATCGVLALLGSDRAGSFLNAFSHQSSVSARRSKERTFSEGDTTPNPRVKHNGQEDDRNEFQSDDGAETAGEQKESHRGEASFEEAVEFIAFNRNAPTRIRSKEEHERWFRSNAEILNSSRSE